MHIYEKDHYLKEEQMFKSIYKTKKQKKHEANMKRLEQEISWKKYINDIVSDVSIYGQTW